ncbi:MAG: lipoyl(octanoyl) transferase LipB [Acidobacteria bacterium]|nr:MAG: lipoyl(octanoyl) transferase LipB [Acidobacteriota bacterium]
MLEVYRLGRQPYAVVLELQRWFRRARQQGRCPDRLILVEHEPVITLGRRATLDHVLVDARTLAVRGIELHAVERGGDVTFHGPGQLVGYPIIHLRERRIAGPRRYVWMLEEVLIRTLAEYGVRAFRRSGFIGVWTERGKIAAIGVSISRGVTMHGFALNVHPDLEAFKLIIPCGLDDRRVAALAQWKGDRIVWSQLEHHLIAHFARLFGYQTVRLSSMVPRQATMEEST